MLNNFDKPVETDLLWPEQHLTMQCLCCSKEYKLHRLDLHLGQTTTSNKYEQACQFNLGQQQQQAYMSIQSWTFD